MTPAPATPQAAWDAVASDFDKFATPLTITLGNEILAEIEIQPGDRFLDVGAGSGALSIPAARRGARVVATDISPAMVERLRARAEAEGLADVEARVMDAVALDSPDGAFDVTGSQNGVTMLPDLTPGLAEMVRVTKAGGTVVIAAFGPPSKAEFLTFFAGALEAVVPGSGALLSGPPPPPFQVAEPARFHGVMSGAGLTGVEVRQVEWPMAFASAGDLWDFLMGSHPIGRMLAAPLDDDQRGSVRQVLDGMLRERSGGGPAAVLTAVVNIATGTKYERG
jgi:ubiquinone/menaquinone biosynthesis C-methylase UbiE